MDRVRSHIYYKTTKTRAKGRWFNRKLEDIIGELGPGVISVVGDPQHVVQNKDIIEFVTHVHEPPTPQEVSVVFSNEKFVVVNKPSGLPTHPTLNYYRNSVTRLLEPDFGELHPCYRLDRLTSGLLIMAKSSEAVREFHTLDKRKKYLARTERPHGVKKTLDIKYNIPVFNPKRGLLASLSALESAKPAHTIVSPVSETVLSCEPLTGRTHQIRKHLALAGMPINNDPLYSDMTWANLVRKPSEENFTLMWNAAEKRRKRKLLPQRCSECNAEVYTNTFTEALDLHCASYTLGDLYFSADPSWCDVRAQASWSEAGRTEG